MRTVDADSLIRQIKIRVKWHKDYTIEEVIEDIKSAPTVEEEKDASRCDTLR